MSVSHKALSRRQFLKLSLAAVGAGLLSSCASPSAQPTQVPGPQQSAGTQTPVATPAAAITEAVSTEEPKIGSTLIGKLEGPEVITDVSLYPTEFKEAPDLAALVQAGSLPPVKERIGEDPLVVKPVHEIGEYGGIWRRGFTGPGDGLNGVRAASGPDSLMQFDPTGTTIIPCIAKSMEVNEDGTAFTFFLRKGMKWSDGEPLTADDFMFWWEDKVLNEELTPTPTSYMKINGKLGRVEKVDDYTVRFAFDEPYWMFPEVIAGTTVFMPSSSGGFLPKHYLQQFHPKYTPQEELDKKVADEGYDTWVNLFNYKADWGLNPDLPVVSPWKVTSGRNKEQWIYERNPYSIWVDTEGNQLPYIDQIVMTLAENLEVLNLRAVAGEYDFQGRHISLSKLPVLIENQEKGDYEVHLDIGQYGADLVVWIDLWYNADPVIGDLLRNTDFRRALSLGLDRDELNETFWLGTGTPGSIAPADDNKFNPGPEYRTLWATYDPDKANEMLDSLGLDKRDASGLRMRPDGSGPLYIEIMTKAAQFLEFTQMAEMMKVHWEKLGIGVTVKEVERALGYTIEANNESQISLWTNDGSDNPFLWTASALPTVFGGFSEWFNSFGEKGTAPYPPLKEATEIFWASFGAPEAERIEMGKQFWKIMIDEVIQMGVVGLGAASQGVRVNKTKFGNAPDRQYCTPWVKNPAVSNPATFYWKK